MARMLGSLVLLSLFCSACLDWSRGRSEPDDGGVASDATSSSTSPDDPTLRGQNVPALGGLVSVGAPRRNSAAGPKSLLLFDDGFELGETVCTAAGACLSGAIAP